MVASLNAASASRTRAQFTPVPESEAVRAFARALHLRSGSEWAAFANGEMPEKGALPPDVPRAPQQVFRRRGWKGWGDFLGTGNIAGPDREWRSFAEARRFARSRQLRSKGEWSRLVRGAHPDLPCVPARAYRGQGWKGWCDFLGMKRRGRTRRSWRSFEEARSFARGLGFGSSRAWEEWSRGDRPDLAPRPADIPGVPYVAYSKDGWRGWRDFLGSERVRAGVDP